MATGKMGVGTDMLAPVAALTRFRPDASGFSSKAGVQAATARHSVMAGDTGFLLPCQEKVEIVEPGNICPIPNTPMWFTGMINHRGNLYPVFDLALYLGQEVKQPHPWVMITGAGVKAAGLSIDSLPVAIENPRRLEASEDGGETAIPAVLRPHLAGLYLHDGKLWLDVDYARLFALFREGFKAALETGGRGVG